MTKRGSYVGRCGGCGVRVRTAPTDEPMCAGCASLARLRLNERARTDAARVVAAHREDELRAGMAGQFALGL